MAEDHELDFENLPNCCGIAVINDFGNTANTGGEKAAVSIKHLEQKLKDTIKHFLVRNKAMVIVSLNDTQKRKLHKMMLRNGFTVVSRGWHPLHSNYITLYTLVYTKSSKRPRVVTSPSW